MNFRVRAYSPVDRLSLSQTLHAPASATTAVASSVAAALRVSDRNRCLIDGIVDFTEYLTHGIEIYGIQPLAHIPGQLAPVINTAQLPQHLQQHAGQVFYEYARCTPLTDCLYSASLCPSRPAAAME